MRTENRLQMTNFTRATPLLLIPDQADRYCMQVFCQKINEKNNKYKT